MGIKCLKCGRSVSRHDDYLQCSGKCKITVHIACAKVSEDEYVNMKKSGAVKRWKCDRDCDIESSEVAAGGDSASSVSVVSGDNPAMRRCLSAASETDISPCGRCSALFRHFSNALEKLEQRVASEMQAFRSQLVGEFEAVLSSSLEKIQTTVREANAPLESTSVEPKTFAEAVSDTCSFVVRPVNPSQSISATKTDLYQKLNPVKNKLGLAQVRGIKGGGVVVNCSDSAESNKFKSMAMNKLSTDYTVKEVASLLPRIKLVGLSEKLEKDEFVNCLRVQNKGVISDGVCNFVNCKPLRNKSDVYQVVVQVDRVSYRKALAAGRLFIGYDNCAVYDAVEVVRCYNCSGLNHMSKGCRLKSVCPKCSEQHLIKDCKSEVARCVNCVKFNEKSGGSVDVHHAAWDNDCPSYSRALASVRSEILGVK